MTKLFLSAGALLAGLAVILGAFGAHALKSRLDERLLNAFHTAVDYQMYHSLALVLVGILMTMFPAQTLFKISGFLFIAGIFLFSGSLYLLALTSAKWAGPITPLGGLIFIIAWLTLAYGALKL